MNKIVGGVAGAGALGGAYYYLTQPGPPKNAAFVFVKPHAVTPAVNKLVREGLQAKGLKVMSEGDLASEVIDKKKLIDQHYYAIASKATILKPDQLNVPDDKFSKQFGMTYKEALATGNVYNAMDACDKLGMSADEMAKAWGVCGAEKKLVKLGGGFYCGLIEVPGKTPLYVFNGFFMSLRAGFTRPGLSIHWYTVEWDEKTLSWEDFRGKLLGPTNPADAPKDSLRGKVLSDWQALGLKSQPNTGDNGVHASASPFEGMAERMNWLGQSCRRDAFCQGLIKAGVAEATINAWSVDPQVNLGGGKKGSMFDSVEDMDCSACLEKAKQLNALQ